MPGSARRPGGGIAISNIARGESIQVMIKIPLAEDRLELEFFRREHDSTLWVRTVGAWYHRHREQQPGESFARKLTEKETAGLDLALKHLREQQDNVTMAGAPYLVLRQFRRGDEIAREKLEATQFYLLHADWFDRTLNSQQTKEIEVAAGWSRVMQEDIQRFMTFEALLNPAPAVSPTVAPLLDSRE